MADTVYFNGSYLQKEEVHISPDDRGFIFSDGIYEVVRSYAGNFFALNRHLERLGNGLAALSITGFAPHTFVEVAQELLRRNDLEGANATVYMQVTRGAAPRLHAFPNPSVAPTVYASAAAFEPKADPAVGISVITVPDIRWARCDIKTVGLLPNCLANQQAQEAGAQEAIFVRDGVALEGTATSFFGVFGGMVRTAPRSNYILPSITREITLELCREQGVRTEERPIFVNELGGADELFLAGTTMEIMPIVAIDGTQVDCGQPGPISRRLLECLWARAR